VRTFVAGSLSWRLRVVGGRQVLGRGELEPHAADGGDEAGMRGVVFELLAEPRDVDVERLGGTEPVPLPDLVHDVLVADDVAGVGHEHVERSNSLTASSTGSPAENGLTW
jgi:hypothetical protein